MIFEKNVYECCWGGGDCPLYLSLVLMARLIIKLTQDQINRRKKQFNMSHVGDRKWCSGKRLKQAAIYVNTVHTHKNQYTFEDLTMKKLRFGCSFVKTLNRMRAWGSKLVKSDKFCFYRLLDTEFLKSGDKDVACGSEGTFHPGELFLSFKETKEG